MTLMFDLWTNNNSRCSYILWWIDENYLTTQLVCLFDNFWGYRINYNQNSKQAESKFKELIHSELIITPIQISELLYLSLFNIFSLETCNYFITVVYLEQNFCTYICFIEYHDIYIFFMKIATSAYFVITIDIKTNNTKKNSFGLLDSVCDHHHLLTQSAP